MPAPADATVTFSQALRLVLQAARPAVDAVEIARLGDGVDWAKVRQLAQRHRVAPLVVHGLTTANIAVPPDLRTAAMAATERAMRLAAELVRLSDGLRGRGIACLSIKGPIEGALVYGGAARRSCSDVDLVVRGAQVDEAAAWLRRAGYDALHDAAADKRVGQSTFRHGAHGGLVDLHWQWTATSEAFPLDIDAVLATATSSIADACPTACR